MSIVSAKRRLRMSHREVENFAIHVVKTAVEEYGAEVRHLKFICSQKETSAAFVDPRTFTMTVNLGRMRTLRDLVYCIGHEACHTIQAATASPHGMLMAYHRNNFIYGYRDNPLEVEADTFGFAFENDMEYENRVINSDTESLFINRKVLRG